MLNTGTYMFTDGSVSSSVSVMMQFINEESYNRDVALLDVSVLDFNPNTQLLPITDISITGARADVSSAKVWFKAKFSMNLATNLAGIAIANLRFTIDGVVDTITALSLSYDTTTEEWSFTPTTTLTTAQDLVVMLYDAGNSVDVALIGTKYYKGTSGEFNAVA